MAGSTTDEFSHGIGENGIGAMLLPLLLHKHGYGARINYRVKACCLHGNGIARIHDKIPLDGGGYGVECVSITNDLPQDRIAMRNAVGSVFNGTLQAFRTNDNINALGVLGAPAQHEQQHPQVFHKTKGT